MADIIDFEFYRKFRIVLPVRPNAHSIKSASTPPRTFAKQYRRRRKDDLVPPTKTKNDS